MRNRLFLLFSLIVMNIGVITAQSRNVTGIVVSSEDGEPIIGASVLVKGTTTATITGLRGDFSFTNLSETGKSLIVSYVGMMPQEVPIKSGTIKIVLVPEIKGVEQVAVGYGSRQKKDVTSSISKVKGDDIGNLAASSFDSQLAGRAAGVQVSTSSGALGSTPVYKVRGLSSFSSGTQPLIIIDGVPASSDSSSGVNAMSGINPNDIESIEVLKDGAATAIYGSRAANGVVLITTKKGNEGSAKISYDGYIGIASVGKTHNLLNAQEFVEITNEKYTNKGLEGLAVYDGTNTDWNDYIYQSAFQQSHSISASGGTKKGSSDISSDIINIDKKKTAEEFVFLNNHKQIYKYEQQFSISCVGSIQPPMYQRRIQR